MIRTETSLYTRCKSTRKHQNSSFSKCLKETFRFLRIFTSLKIVWQHRHRLELVVLVSPQQGPHLQSLPCLLPLEGAAQLAVVGRGHFLIWARGRGGKHVAQELCSNLLTEDPENPDWTSLEKHGSVPLFRVVRVPLPALRCYRHPSLPRAVLPISRMVVQRCLSSPVQKQPGGW